jgi:2-dehydropantoate 2-reductase
MTESMAFAVLGPGGVGGFLAAMLARQGDSVVVLAGEETSRALGASGLRLESARFGNFDVPVRTATRLAEPVAACLVTVKATQLREAVERVPASAVGEGLVIPFLNGLDHVGFLREVYGEERVVAATIRIETARVRTGLIRHTSPFAIVDVAPSDANRDRVERIASRLSATGIDVRVRDDERFMLWDKFAVLAPMALLTTHERAPLGAVRSRRREDLVRVVHEVAAVAHAEGVDVDAEKQLRFIDSVPESMESSMQRDQEAGRALELDALGTAILRRAGAHGVDVPVTRRLVEELELRTSRGARRA